MKRYSSVEAYFSAQESWHAEQQLLRNILRACPLVEELRWGSPVYSHSGNNVVGIRGFKSYFGLWFFQGVLLRDKNRVLINAQEGKTKALRQWRMSSAEEIRPELIQSYVKEAIELAGQGKSIAIDRSPRPLEILNCGETLEFALPATKHWIPGQQGAKGLGAGWLDNGTKFASDGVESCSVLAPGRGKGCGSIAGPTGPKHLHGKAFSKKATKPSLRLVKPTQSSNWPGCSRTSRSTMFCRRTKVRRLIRRCMTLRRHTKTFCGFSANRKPTLAARRGRQLRKLQLPKAPGRPATRPSLTTLTSS